MIWQSRLCFLRHRCNNDGVLNFIAAIDLSYPPKNMKKNLHSVNSNLSRLSKVWNLYFAVQNFRSQKHMPAGTAHSIHSVCCSASMSCFTSGHQPFYIRASYGDIYGAISDLQMCSLLRFPFWNLHRMWTYQSISLTWILKQKKVTDCMCISEIWNQAFNLPIGHCCANRCLWANGRQDIHINQEAVI